MRGGGGRPRLRHHTVASRHWNAPALRIGVLSDLHLCEPWSPLSALEEVIDLLMAQAPDLIVLPGDFLVRGLALARPVPADRIAESLARLRAPLGVRAVLGNHDWKDCPLARATRQRRNSVAEALPGAGIPVLSNAAEPLGDGSVWLVGLDSQQSLGTARRPVPRHDPDAAFARVPKGASTILLAHEPDIFLSDPRPVALQISGHTHGGQIGIGAWRPLTPSRYGGRLARGLHSEGERHLVVSAGLGYSGLPLRINAPPEVVIVDLAPGG